MGFANLQLNKPFDSIKTTNQTDSHTINAALRMTRQRHGDHLTITGTDEFKQKVVEVAVAEGMKVTFTCYLS